MKKLDLHIHTVPTVWDAHFTFDQGVLEQYVTDTHLDAIAITNHNVFDRDQFESIRNGLDILVLPGVEVTLDCGHMLVISEPDNVGPFAQQVTALAADVAEVTDAISLADLMALFTLSECLVIPHYDKTNAIPEVDLAQLESFVSCGEVESVKKFERARKAEGGLTPVLFSDCRISAALDHLPTRQTYVDCGDLSLSALKACLRDKTKVALSKTQGLFQIFDNGQQLSTGLTVVLGARSSGKSYLLDQIHRTHEHIKYLKQFSLVERDETQSSREFTEDLGRKHGRIRDRYLATFKDVVDEVVGIDLSANDRAVEEYVRSIHDSARELNRQDIFSKAALFDESPFRPNNNDDLEELIIRSVALSETSSTGR